MIWSSGRAAGNVSWFYILHPGKKGWHIYTQIWLDHQERQHSRILYPTYRYEMPTNIQTDKIRSPGRAAGSVSRILQYILHPGKKGWQIFTRQEPVAKWFQTQYTVQGCGKKLIQKRRRYCKIFAKYFADCFFDYLLRSWHPWDLTRGSADEISGLIYL